MTLLTFFSGTPTNESSYLRSSSPTQPIIAGDSVELLVFAFDREEDQGKDFDSITSATFTVRKPDDVVFSADGVITNEGGAFLRVTDTGDVGTYRWIVRFVFESGEVRSYTSEFKTYDPFIENPQTQKSIIAEEVWMRLEDCFDSELGGPWLRDQTLRYFDSSKIERFIPEGLVFINGWPPITNFGLDTFTTQVPDPDPALPPGSLQSDPDMILIVQATLLAVIKHLMRSYVEQPLPQGANIVWQSKRDYLERWNTIYNIEWDFFKEIVALWKRQFLQYGKTSLLIHNKAGRLGYATGYRARNAARGYG